MLEHYLMVHKSILPEYYEKVLFARHLMESGKVREVSQAVRQAGISRSTYYKYKDYIFEPSDMSGSRKGGFVHDAQPRTRRSSALCSSRSLTPEPAC